VYADAGLFLLPLLHTKQVPPAEAAANFLESVARGSRRVCTATLTWDEVVYVIRRLLGPEDSREKAEDLLALPNVTWIPADLAVVREASVLYRDLPIRPRDAIHAASGSGQSRLDRLIAPATRALR